MELPALCEYHHFKQQAEQANIDLFYKNNSGCLLFENMDQNRFRVRKLAVFWRKQRDTAWKWKTHKPRYIENSRVHLQNLGYLIFCCSLLFLMFRLYFNRGICRFVEEPA